MDHLDIHFWILVIIIIRIWILVKKCTLRNHNISLSIVESFIEDIFTVYDFRLLESHSFRIAYHVKCLLNSSSKKNTYVNQTTAASVWR